MLSFFSHSWQHVDAKAHPISDLNITVLLAALSTFIAALFAVYHRSSHPHLLPPSPPSYWIYGHTFPRYSWRLIHKWHQEYGPVITLYRGPRRIVSIGTMRAAQDIMEKEGVHLADRPRMIAASDLLSGGLRILVMSSGTRFKKYRKALHAYLGPQAASTHEAKQAECARFMSQQIFKDPEHFLDHSRRFASTVALNIAYGYTEESDIPQIVSDVNVCLHYLASAIQPGNWLVDVIPLLQYVPGYAAPLKRAHQLELKLYRGHIDKVRQNMKAGDSHRCFARYMLENQDDLRMSDDDIAYLSGEILAAGSDTTAAAISFAIMAAALFPEAQAQVQKELDDVVGRSRLPTFKDELNLPVTHAFIQELLRWRPITAGGFAHLASQDIVYKEYVIPKGTAVVANHWSLSRDTDVFPDPDRFDLGRWLDGSGRLCIDHKLPTFGFGRRHCPASSVANRSFFITISTLLWAFDVRPLPGSVIDPDDVRDTANIHPNPFRVEFKLRDSDVERVLFEAQE